MIAVADTSPLRYLVLVEKIDVLSKLFQRILIPQAVQRELLHPSAPVAVKGWAAALPGWVEVRAADGQRFQSILDPGESEAISLALESKTDLILLDEIEARQAALSLGLAVAGTVGLLEKASEAGLLNFEVTIQNLLRTNFRVERKLVQDALARNRQRNLNPESGDGQKV